jgi:cytochrome c oxidase subunit 2
MKRIGAAASLAALTAPAVAMNAPPMSYLRTFGPAGDPATRLGHGLGIVSIVVMVVITVLLLVAIYRRRAPPRSARELAVARDGGGLSWICIGVGVSTAVLVACAVWTMFTIAAVAMPARAANLTLHVTASQWWWDVRYRDPEPSNTFEVANEIHIPVGIPVKLELESIDVIHSFWIPQLAGKTDVIPGQTNLMWLQADQPGIYRGQCGEFCGAQHAHMSMFVVADTAAEFAAWSKRQRADAVMPVGDAVQHGAQTFVSYCGACHRVRGTGAGGILGPDLTHVMSRQTIAAGMLRNTPGNLAAWIANAQALKPGTRMPTMALSGPDLNAVVAYLDTLR